MRHIPQRTCVGCRSIRAKPELVRVVCSSDGCVGVDATGKLNGRGAYLCPRLGCLTLAVRRKAFDRAFRRPVSAMELAAVQQGLESLVAAAETPGAEGNQIPASGRAGLGSRGAAGTAEAEDGTLASG